MEHVSVFRMHIRLAVICENTVGFLLSALGQHGFAVSIETERAAVRAKLPWPHL